MKAPPALLKALHRTTLFPANPALKLRMQRWASDLQLGLVAGLSILAVMAPSGNAPLAGASRSAHHPPVWSGSPLPAIDWGNAEVSNDVKQIVLWRIATRDHADKPFVVVDKLRAHLYLFDATARLMAHSPVLLGSAAGDHSMPGIGAKAIADVLPEDRTTPAGRFEGRVGDNLSGEQVVWVDYDAAVSLHRVRAKVVGERRLERLASETASDNRISYGCINVPVEFFEAHLLPLFNRGEAVIYVLPEHESLDRVFGVVP